MADEAVVKYMVLFHNKEINRESLYSAINSEGNSRICRNIAQLPSFIWINLMSHIESKYQINSKILRGITDYIVGDYNAFVISLPSLKDTSIQLPFKYALNLWKENEYIKRDIESVNNL